ncbi:MAG: RNA polymerase sigma factor [Actinomycetota bacterium]|nr:RNA polymerase sigma factor [Actinomycetota bacterium]
MKRPTQNRSDSVRQLVPPDLVDRCKSGDEAAWKELVELTHREVYTLCLRILNDPGDAAEATQDAYLKAWRGLKGFRGDAQFTTWLYRVASNAAISKHRSRKRRRVHEVGVEDELLSGMAAPGSVEATAEIRRDVRELEAAIRNLPDHYRSAVVLRDVYGMSIAEISKELKITETAAKVRVHRGRKKLKEAIYGEGSEGRPRPDPQKR